MSTFFHSPEWRTVLERGFGARTVIMPSETPLQFTLFQVGPFSFSYAEFPIGLSGLDTLTQIQTPETRIFLKRCGAHILRFTTDIKNKQTNSSNVVLPETVIANLSTWDEDTLESSVRYEIRRAHREGLRIRSATTLDSETIFNQYFDTVTRHGGVLRYTRAYFKALLALSEHDSRIFVRVGETRDGEVCGFIIVVHDDVKSHYLHGGFDHRHSNLRPGYGLLAEAITAARDRGSLSFNLMSSPADQPALVKFKEKWRGITSMKGTQTIALGPMGHILLTSMRTLKTLHGLVRA